MSWMRTSLRSSARPGFQSEQAKEAILACVHRGLLLASASRRLQDSISSRRASAEAHYLLTDVKRLCAQTTDPNLQDERVQAAIESLTRALEAGDLTQQQDQG